MKKHVPYLVSFIIAAMALGCAGMCVFWLPAFAAYAAPFLGVAEWVVSLVCAVIALPLFLIFALAAPFPGDIKNDSIFSIAVSRRLKVIAILLAGDCLVFCVGMGLLLISGEYLLSPALGAVGVIGLVVAYVLLILSNYIKNAAALKEEVDATL